MTGYELLPDEQKALRKSTRGCLDALTIDEAAYREAQVNGGGWRLECLPTGLCHITSCYPPPPPCSCARTHYLWLGSTFARLLT